MSGSNVTGHVLGTATTVSGTTALSAATGHHSIAFFTVIVAMACIALVIVSKLVKRLVVLFAKPL